MERYGDHAEVVFKRGCASGGVFPALGIAHVMVDILSGDKRNDILRRVDFRGTNANQSVAMGSAADIRNPYGKRNSLVDDRQVHAALGEKTGLAIFGNIVILKRRSCCKHCRWTGC